MARRRILLAEDSPTQRAQTLQVIEQAGFDAIPAANGTEALEKATELLPDAFVLDIVMPGMDGFEVCRRIRALPGGATVPVVLLTSLSDTADVLRGLEAGADSFVVKPCRGDYLPRLLSMLIERNDARCVEGPNGSLDFSYHDQAFRITPDYQRMLTLLLGSYESAAQLNHQLAEAHARLSEQALQLKRTVHRQANQIDRQLEERRNVESQLYHYQRMDAVDRLASAMAHDFNNMLMVIRGFTDYLLRDTEEANKQYKYLEEIKKATDRAAELTERLLIFSRKQEFAEEVFDLGRLLWDIHSMLKSILGDTIELNIVESGGAAPVRADKHQIEQVIVNLTTNARDAMTEGGAYTLEIDGYEVAVGSRESELDVDPGRYTRLVVRDTGCGIPPDIVEHIFEPFYTTKESGKGTGLGLSTVFGVVRKSGGYVLCSSEVGAGTQFTIFLPTVPAFKEGESDDGSANDT